MFLQYQSHYLDLFLYALYSYIIKKEAFINEKLSHQLQAYTYCLSAASQSSTVSSVSGVAGGQTAVPPATAARPAFGRQSSTSAQSTGAPGEDSEDTMKNLRKTFAGIFGDM